MARYTFSKSDSGYCLNDELSSQQALLIDFLSAKMQYRINHGGKRELLLKAVKAKPGLLVWDCTAGLGVDSLLLAAAGCRVLLFERSIILAYLLEDAIKRARDSSTLSAVANRMELVKHDSLSYLNDIQAHQRPDVIFIDPMFPSKRKSAQVKGEMQVLQHFIGKDEDADVLMRAAIATKCPRVVVKRPTVGGELKALVPDYSLMAKSNRFDIYIYARTSD